MGNRGTGDQHDKRMNEEFNHIGTGDQGLGIGAAASISAFIASAPPVLNFSCNETYRK
ncbi:MAG: hypothetical protein LBU85_03495 [Treponema sp.]|nr:hypothetical protein [Treponema sp.]